jgi:diaminopimelate epimerase
VSPPGLSFEKYEGLGNDFILVEATDERAVPPELAVRLCDRHFGIGADGVLLLLPPRTSAAARVRILNADGSVPEMCGNGVRCVARHVAQARGLGAGTVRIETDAGERACEVAADGTVTVDMGVLRVIDDLRIEIEGEAVSMSLADAGNPHAVLLGVFARADVERLGPRIATHAAFPHGTNVEFARLAAPNTLDAIVWERGVGITMACGTGACATAAVAQRKGLVAAGRPVVVRLPGGSLEIVVGDGGRTTMRGPARRVFAGTTD